MPLLDSWSYIWFLCEIILRGTALNTAKTAFLKQSSIQKTNFPKAINYQEKKKTMIASLLLATLASHQDISCFSDLLLV